ncbi:MAG: metallophosphoesterase [Candidatus Mariimomonas ferrooxydans]
MNLFLISFFSLYALMHLYVFLKTKAGLAFGTWGSVFLLLFMLTMVFAPVIVRFSERASLEVFARTISYIGFTWMGVLFLFISVSVVIDIYRILIYIAGFISGSDLNSIKLSVRSAFYVPLLISLSIASYGYFEARDIRTETLVIKTSKIPREVGRLKIVQISDIHLGLIVREKRLKRILREVTKANPDILVSTGDLVDGQMDGLKGLAELFNKINLKYGKFAVTGNHEFYAGIDNSLDFTKRAGFKVIRGEGLTVSGLINIAGVDDPAGKNYNLFKDVSEKKLLSGLPREKFTLLLKHRPTTDKSSSGLFDLQLSGHTHKGQIFPFSLITRLYYPVHTGSSKLTDNSFLYVSRGSGTWGPPIRFLSPPEVTVIELVYHENQESGNKSGVSGQ